MIKKALLACVCLCLCLALTGCGGGKTPAATEAPQAKKTLEEKAEAALSDYASLVRLPFEDLEDMTGISRDMVTEYLYLQGEDALSGREVVVLRAADAAKAEEILPMMEKYLEDRKKESRNYLPEAYKLQEAAKAERRNGTVVLCVGEKSRDESAALLAGE